MPVVRVADIATLTQEVVRKFELQEGVALSADFQKHFAQLAQEINASFDPQGAAGPIKKDTLYRNVYLRVRREQEKQTPFSRFSRRYLDGLAAYAHQKKYEELFPVYDQEPDSLPEAPAPSLSYIILAPSSLAQEALHVLDTVPDGQVLFWELTSDAKLAELLCQAGEGSRILHVLDEESLTRSPLLTQLWELFRQPGQELWQRYLRHTVHLLLQERHEHFFQSLLLRLNIVEAWQKYVAKAEKRLKDQPLRAAEAEVARLRALAHDLPDLLDAMSEVPAFIFPKQPSAEVVRAVMGVILKP